MNKNVSEKIKVGGAFSEISAMLGPLLKGGAYALASTV